MLIGFDNKVMAGAWIAGQADNQLRVTDMAKRLHVPLVWLVNCSGVKLPEQEEVYADRRGNGTTFFRHAELEKLGVPVLAGIYGTNPAGGGYQGISPTILLAHKDANIAVGGGGIVSGMSPKGSFDEEGAEAAHRGHPPLQGRPAGKRPDPLRRDRLLQGGLRDRRRGPGRREGVRWTYARPTIPKFFRVAEPAEPKLPRRDIDYLIPFNQKKVYNFEEVLARLFGQQRAHGVPARLRPGGLLRGS